MRNFAVCLIWILFIGSVQGQQEGAAVAGGSGNAISGEDAQTAIHERLRELRDRMFSAYEKRDIDALLKDVGSDVVITWQNADRNVGHDEFRSFYERMMSPENGVVKEISSKFDVDGLSFLYGDGTAVARGTQSDTFTLNDGSHFTLNSKWTATIVKDNDAWKVVSFHVSANIFDNPILDVTKAWLLRSGIAGAIAGLIIGLVIGRVISRKRTAK